MVAPFSELARCRRQLEELRESHVALLDHFSEIGVLRKEAFLAQLHRHRFAVVKQNHPMPLEISLHDLTACPHLIALTAFFAGASAVGAIKATSRAISSAYSSAVRCAAKLHVWGGSTTAAFGSVEAFDAYEREWKAAQPILQPKRRAAAAAIAGQLYLCGGQDQHLQPVDTVERFDPNLGVWEAAPFMLQCRFGAAAAALHRHLYVCGGRDGREILSSVERFDPRAGVWEAAPPMLQSRSQVAAAPLCGELYLCGGTDVHQILGLQILDSVERFNPILRIWEPAPSMLQSRFGAAAAALQNRLYLCGGQDGYQQSISSVECFNSEACTWEPAPPMTHSRFGAAATALAGKLYICGGRNGRHILSSVESYNPNEGTWDCLPCMLHARSHGGVAAVGSLW
mmetsp:Transcript_56973/g.99610  ORF Transcript_56973/g.99610 Transcript_56973/m.99610 type:complete len:399 (+) Transcript_56973:35-1231(+)